jgi:hypothetical protein
VQHENSDSIAFLSSRIDELNADAAFDVPPRSGRSKIIGQASELKSSMVHCECGYAEKEGIMVSL